MMTGGKGRDCALDACKAVLISIVVLCHVLQYHVPGEVSFHLQKYIRTFFMGAFMLVSGYVGFANPLTTESMRRKLLRLIVPFFSWGVVSFLLRQFPSQLMSGFGTYFLWLLKSPAIGLWFLWVLACLILWLYAIQRLSHLLHVAEPILAVASFAAMAVFNRVVQIDCLSFGATIHWFPFFFIGYCMRRHESLWNGWGKVLCFGGIAVHTVGFLIESMRGEYFGVLSFMVSVSGAIGFFLIFKVASGRWMKHPVISGIGIRTLGIYAVHQEFPTLMQKIPCLPVIGGWLMWIAVLLASFGIVMVIERSKVASFLLLGTTHGFHKDILAPKK